MFFLLAFGEDLATSVTSGSGFVTLSTLRTFWLVRELVLLQLVPQFEAKKLIIAALFGAFPRSLRPA
jgi:hypothetical protein